jgi:SynChlorMet cassette radical SAM/SPASM protein ScmF
LSSVSAPPLQTIYFYITDACNLHCAHCWLSMEGRDNRTMELSTAEIADVLDQARPLGLQSIKITGGEPFLREDIPEIIAHADRLGLRITIESNAMLVDEATAQALGKVQRLRHVAVSLDGATPESHAVLRGSARSFDTAVEGIRRLIRHGVQIQIITALHKGNLDEIEALLALASELGASEFKINPINVLGRGQDMADRGTLLSLEQVLELNQRLDDGLGERYGMPVYMTLPVAFRTLKTIRRQGLDSCGVMNLLAVLPGGELSMCGIGTAHEDLVFGHVCQTPIKEVWAQSPGLTHIREAIARWPTGLCLRCMMRSYCTWGYCRAEAYAILGSLSAPAPFCLASFEAGLFPAQRLLP